MTVQHETLAVIGSSPFAAFLAGLLASDQKKPVTLVRAAGASSPLDHGADLTFPVATRPDTWLLLDTLLPEAIRALSRFRTPVLERTDLHLVASSTTAATALDHVAQTAFGFGVPLEPVTLAGASRAVRVLDRYRLLPDPFWAQMLPWLDSAGVRVVGTDALEAVEADGSARISGEIHTQAILADDAAVSAWGPGTELSRIGQFVPHATVLTEPTAALRVRLALDLDSGTLVQERATGSVQLFGVSSAFALPASLGPLLGRTPMRLAGIARGTAFVARDGAAVIGAGRRHRAITLAALGPASLVLAPAIARWIAGTATPAEAEWCAARRMTRGASTPPVAEPVPPSLVEA